MSTPIDNDEAVIDGKETAVDSPEANENISGDSVSVTEAVGAKKSFIDDQIPTNTSLNPTRHYVSDVEPAAGTPSSINTNLKLQPKYKASNIDDSLRIQLRKYWLVDQNRFGMSFYNKNTHKQGVAIGYQSSETQEDPNPMMPQMPLSLHITSEDIEHAYSPASNTPLLSDEEGGISPFISDDNLQDPRMNPDHEEHKQFLFYALGMSRHNTLQGDERLERIVYSYTPDYAPEGSSLSTIQNINDWNWFLGEKDKPGLVSYEGIAMQMPVYENYINGVGDVLSNYKPDLSSKFVHHDLSDINKDILSHPFILNGNNRKHPIFSWQLARIKKMDDSVASGKGEARHHLPIYHDHAFTYSTPTSRKKLTDENAKIKTMVYEAQPEYNMFMQNYETATKWESIPESLLPNLYMFLSEMKNEDLENLLYFNHITLNQNLLADYVQQWLGENGGFLKAKQAMQSQAPSAYFKQFANIIREFSEGAESDALVQMYSRTGFSFDGLKDIMNDARMRSFMFPMNINLSFNTDKKTFMAQLMKESRLTCVFSKALSFGQNIVTKETPFRGYFQEARQYRDLNTGEAKVENTVMPEPLKNYRSWDVKEFIEAIDSLGPNIFGDSAMNETDHVMLGYGDKVDMTAPENVLYRFLMTTLFSAKAKKFIKNNTRSYLDILKGKQAYNETLFYKIEKRRRPNQDNYTEYFNSTPNPDSDPEEGTLVQVVMLPNSNELDVFEYIDTQVKYGYKYDYKVTAYQLVLGTEYQFCRTFSNLVETFGKDDDTGKPISHSPIYSALTHVVSRPSPKILEVPYFGNSSTDRVTACVIDDPPVPPDYEILPYKGYANKILLNFAPNTGEYMQTPIVIEEMDNKKFSDAYISQNISPPMGPIRFSSDEPVAIYEIFRSTKAPYSYEDFKDKKIKQIRFEPPDFLTSYVDNIQPNKKYYYTFRAVDGHSWISNPTPVMQIELVENDGAVYLLQEEYIFPKIEDSLVTTKDVKKYLYIEPAQAQIAIDYSRMELELGDSAYNMPEGETPALGVQNEMLVGKKFKIRVKSRNTGKVFDINFVFNQDHLPVDQSSLSYYLNTLVDNLDENENI